MKMSKNYTLKPQPQKVRIAVNGSPSTRAEMEESYRRYSELWNSQGGCMLYMAMQQWKDAYELLQEHPLYKQRVKQLAKRIDAAWNKMWDIMRQCFESKWNVYCDSLNQMYLNLEQDILFLFLAMKRVLDHNKIPDSNFVARQQMALHCAKHAWIVYERFWSIRDAKILGYYADTFKSFFSYQDPHQIYQLTQDLCHLTCATDKDINFGSDLNCVNALSCLIRHALNEDMLEQSIIEGVKLNSDQYQDVLDKYYDLKGQEERRMNEEKERERITAQENEKDAIRAKLSGKFKVKKAKNK